MWLRRMGLEAEDARNAAHGDRVGGESSLQEMRNAREKLSNKKGIRPDDRAF